MSNQVQPAPHPNMSNQIVSFPPPSANQVHPTPQPNMSNQIVSFPPPSANQVQLAPQPNMSNQIVSFPPPSANQVQPAPQPSILPLGVSEHISYKSKLQEYTQQLSLPLPVYQTRNGGLGHAPVFRSTVLVDNTSYTSPNVFTNLKSAEQDVAKIAFNAVMQKVKDEGSPFICENPIFCKAVLNEYASKKHLNMPTYQTTQRQEGLPAFTSSVVFNGDSFTGPVARNKKDAELLAARVAILSILGKPGPDSCVISNIVKSKYKPYAGLNEVNPSNNTDNVVTPVVTIGGLASGAPPNQGAKFVNTGVMSNIQAVTGNCSKNVATVPVPNQPFHEFKKQKLGVSAVPITPLITFVPPVHDQPLGVGPSSAKKRHKKGRKNKLPTAQFPYPAVAPSQVPGLLPQ